MSGVDRSSPSITRPPPHLSADWREGGKTLIHRNGEITLPIKRHWPHHVALLADKVRSVMNSQIVWSFAESLSAAPRPHSLRRDDGEFVVFCFADPKDADAFWDRLVGSGCQSRGDEPGVKWSRVTVEQPP
jgi:hypothetical protein